MTEWTNWPYRTTQFNSLNLLCFYVVNRATFLVSNSVLRTSFYSCKPAAGIPWSADIVLNDTRVSDAGIYRCMVNNPPETADPGIGELELDVLGECVTRCLTKALHTYLKHSPFNTLSQGCIHPCSRTLIFSVFPTTSATTGVSSVRQTERPAERL